MGISLSTHSEYIEKFAETFYEQCKLLIDRNQVEIKEVYDINKDDVRLLKEVLDHAYFCKETAEKFHGRSDLLDMVNYF